MLFRAKLSLWSKSKKKTGNQTNNTLKKCFVQEDMLKCCVNGDGDLMYSWLKYIIGKNVLEY